jgi:hypothetical protein
LSIYSAIYELGDGEYKRILDEMTFDGYLMNVDVLDEIDDDIELKCIKVSKIVLSLQNDLGAIKSELDRLKKLKDVTEANISSLKDFVLFSMLTLDQKAIDAKYMAIIRRKNPPKVVIDDEKKLDSKYMKANMEIHKVIDRSLIKEDILKGEHVLGAHLEYNESIQIK